MADWSGAANVEDTRAMSFESRFRHALADDLDLPATMALVAELSRSDVAPGAKAMLLRDWDRVLGLDVDRPLKASLPDGASELLEAREKARLAKDFRTSDRLRDELASLGVAVTDTSEGQRWRAAARKAP
jgi:cysteinyl-tRNA synthetase